MSENNDPVNHPSHYTDHPSGIECIQVTEHMGFNLGNAVKYIWRCDLKKDAVEDLKKAIWYIQREISKRNPQVPGAVAPQEPAIFTWIPDEKTEGLLLSYRDNVQIGYIDCYNGFYPYLFNSDEDYVPYPLENAKTLEEAKQNIITRYIEELT